MKRIFTLIAGLTVSMAALATTFTYTNSNSLVQTKDGITVALDKASGSSAPVFNDNKGEVRLYAKNTITVSGSNITSIQIVFSKQGSKDYATLSATPGTLVSGGNSTSNEDRKIDVWTGNADKVTFTLGDSGQRVIYQLVVNGDGSEIDPGNPDTPDAPNFPGTLDPDYVYGEPTSVTVPGTTVQGAEYSFICNNIQVDCTKGAVNENFFSAHAGYKITFSATQPIKGLVINGAVKKDFEATVNHGNISFLSPNADYVVTNPVVVITDIDDYSVTLTCVKQLRCYEVEVYFYANPEATVEGGTIGGGDTVDLTFDSADAVYEAEYVEMIEEENYSIFLYNQASPEVPYFALDIYPAVKDQLAGTYRMADYTLGDFTYYAYGYGDYDMCWALDGNVTIAREGDIYTIKGQIYCDNETTYNISFTGKMPIYLDDDYYYGGESGVKDILDEQTPAPNTDGQTYDLQGRKVSPSYHGIIIRNGLKSLSR